MSNISASLLITLIGMGLVFVALGLLWGLMEATVKGSAWYNKRHPEEVEEEEEEEAEEVVVAPSAIVEALPAGSTLKYKAAAAAVAVALAIQDEGLEAAAEPQPNGYYAQPSAWKSVMRSAQLNQRSNQFTRKSRGNER
jgi:Na+-transporting methylmalonyl-CoA/oxaloacetate decarboxylase gamma subunit